MIAPIFQDKRGNQFVILSTDYLFSDDMDREIARIALIYDIEVVGWHRLPAEGEADATLHLQATFDNFPVAVIGGPTFDAAKEKQQ